MSAASKRHSIQFKTSARSRLDSGEVATPGTRARYSRPPSTRRNFATDPAISGAAPGEPWPSGRWQPWQFSVQCCHARCGLSTPAMAAAGSRAAWAQAVAHPNTPAAAMSAARSAAVPGAPRRLAPALMVRLERAAELGYFAAIYPRVEHGYRRLPWPRTEPAAV